MNSLFTILKENGDEKLTKQVNQFFHKFHIRINAINCLEKQERVFYMDLLMAHSRREINFHFPSDVKSHMKNKITGIYREKLRLIYPGKIKQIK